MEKALTCSALANEAIQPIYTVFQAIKLYFFCARGALVIVVAVHNRLRQQCSDRRRTSNTGERPKMATVTNS